MSASTPKPLSEKPLGYVLAVIAGTLGGPIGWLTSPLTLFGLTKAMSAKDDKVPNRFLVWALIGIVGVPLSRAPLVAFSGNHNASTSPTPTLENNSSQPSYADAEQQSQPTEVPGVNMENYNRIKIGMSYDEVSRILGEQGTEMSSGNINGSPSVTYTWKPRGFSVSNITAFFLNGNLMHKSQFGLK